METAYVPIDIYCMFVLGRLSPIIMNHNTAEKCFPIFSL